MMGQSASQKTFTPNKAHYSNTDKPYPRKEMLAKKRDDELVGARSKMVQGPNSAFFMKDNGESNGHS